MDSYGKVVKSYTVTCASCGRADTYDTQTEIEGKPHIYKGTAELSFEISGIWVKEKFEGQQVWLCYECVNDLFGDDAGNKEAVEQSIRRNMKGE